MSKRNHNPVQFLRTKTIYASKNDAVDAIKLKIESKLDEYVDGEQILFSYYNHKGEACTSSALIGINDGVVSINTVINDKETYKVIESDTEPTDKDSIWVSECDDADIDDSLEMGNLKKEVASLKKSLESLTSLIEKHEYALTHSIAGGDFITNSLKYEIENGYVDEKPEDATDPNEYDTSNSSITSFVIYIANTNITSYCNTNIKLYQGQKYYLRPKYYNSDGNLVDYTNVKNITITSSNESIATVTDNYILEASATGKIGLTATLTTTDNRTITKTYNPIEFEYYDELSYYTYDEPNVRHMLIKKADTYDILTANTDYLCVNELVWCIGNENLYIKAESKDGSFKLFKLTGSNSDSGGEDTPDTSVTPTDVTVTYTYDETTGNLEITSADSSIGVDSDGILTINGTVDENGILIINDTKASEGYTVDGNGIFTATNVTIEDGILTINGTVDENGILILETSSSSSVDNNNVLSLANASVDSDGYLNLNLSVDENGILTI